MSRAARHLYVHLPFCARKCPYCDFNSHANREADVDPYLEALAIETRRRAADLHPVTVFVGGGTPTWLDASRLRWTLGALLDVVGTDRLEELTIEANPGSVDLEKVRVLLDAGVTRVSLGVQSFDDRHLRTLGRIHDASDAVRSVEILRRGGLERLSVDLILAVPGQTLEQQARDVARALDLGPEHVSAYLLTIEKGTAFERMVRGGRLPPPDEDRELEHLHVVSERLAAAGFERYEISNYARAGAKCRHNLAYWESEDWLGVGAGAHSHAGSRRWKNVDDPADYALRMGERGEAIGWVETAPPAVSAFESLMMGLRLTRGVDLERIRDATGLDPRIRWGEALERHVAAGLLVLDEPRLRLTPRGRDLLSYVLRDFLPDEEVVLETRA